MKNSAKFATVSAIALMFATGSFAQGALTGTQALDDRIDTITDDVNDDLARGNDADRFGENGVLQGWRGSFALQTSASSGNTDAGDLSGAGRVTYGIGPWNHSFGFAAEYAEANNVQNEETLFVTYEGSRYISPETYIFGLGRAEYDGFATNEKDAFLGFGTGYRIVNTSDMAWRVQAGPGLRYVENQNGSSESEAAFIMSSRFFMGLTVMVSLTNDTDFLTSDIDSIATNDFGVNFRVTDALTTRVSYRTEYNSDPLPGRRSTDNSLGLSLVVGF